MKKMDRQAALPSGNLWPSVRGGITLVSASPRRADLLRQIGARFSVLPPEHGVERMTSLEPEEVVRKLAEEKTRSVGEKGEGRVLLAADTVVVLDGRILGKPRDPREAAEMLSALSGRGHKVVTGVSVLDRRSGRHASGVEVTRVRFRTLTAGEIEAYVETGEPSDKAGAYGIQGVGALLVERIEGCYFNVVGLPLARTREVLRSVVCAQAG